MCGALAWDPPRASAAELAKYATMKPSDTQTQSASAAVAAEGNGDAFNTSNVMTNSVAEAQA
jgi:hypothetical protein